MQLLKRYFESETSLFAAQPLSRIQQRVAEYATYLDQVRGLSQSTIVGHSRTAGALLSDIDYESTPERLRTLTALDIEAFICRAGRRLKRNSLQGMVAHVRTFLRFVGTSGKTVTGLDRKIDTPRVYREEQLPKALPWETVQALLQAIDRTTLYTRQLIASNRFLAGAPTSRLPTMHATISQGHPPEKTSSHRDLFDPFDQVNINCG